MLSDSRLTEEYKIAKCVEGNRGIDIATISWRQPSEKISSMGAGLAGRSGGKRDAGGAGDDVGPEECAVGADSLRFVVFGSLRVQNRVSCELYGLNTEYNAPHWMKWGWLLLPHLMVNRRS